MVDRKLGFYTPLMLLAHSQSCFPECVRTNI